MEFNDEKYNEAFKDVDVDLNILKVIWIHFDVPTNMLRHIYDRVISLNSNGTNIYKCMDIVTNELIKQDYEIKKLIREYMNR